MLGIPTILTTVFVTLKLTEHIDWSWWWVLSPLWIPTAIGLTLLAIVLFISAIAALLKGTK